MVELLEPGASQVLGQEDKAALVKRLRDPIWRINNLYTITNKDGVEVPFRLNAAQRMVAESYYRDGVKRHIILKSRQIGFSTLIDVMMFDAIYWAEQPLQGSIVDQTQPDASEKLRTKVRFVHEKMPDFMREPLTRENEKQVECANGGIINAGKNARGGTNQWLHISEWGPIAHEDPKRSQEIKTGALPSAEKGSVFVESTFKGGKGGDFYALLKMAMETRDEDRTAKDFKFWFFGWWESPDCTLEGNPDIIDRETNRYLNEKEKELKARFPEKFSGKFTRGQRVFYYVTKREQGIFMFREYPTTPEEAFKAPVEGAIYGEIISKIRSRGQIRDFIYDPSYPLWAAYDLGWNDSTTIWIFQVIGRDLHWVWHRRRRHHTAAQMWKLVTDAELPVSGCFLPHDGGHHRAGNGLSYKEELEKAGAMNVVVVPQTKDKWAGINAARDILHRSIIHKTECEAGLDSLEAYHTKDSESGGTITKDPVHDWSSHDSDGFRTAAEALTLGLVKTKVAQRVNVTTVPKAPDGDTVVDVDLVRDTRRRQRRGRAKSGVLL